MGNHNSWNWKKNSIEILKEIHFPHSLGLLYSAFTYYLGFKVNSGEYKVMGLAPYGEPKYKDLILSHLINVKDDGSFKLNMNYFDYATDLKMTNSEFDNLFQNKRRVPESDKLTQFHMDVACSVQSVIEEIVLKITQNIKEEFKIENLCMAGGVALNCVANGKILKDKNFKNIWIQPSSGDAGGSLGAALAYWHIELGKEKINKKDSMNGSYLGPKFSNENIKKSLTTVGANFKELKEEDLLKNVIDNLKNEKAIGWFQGRMEYGPRALGARSIIADPRFEKMQKKLNLKIKFRESFRPFAPSVLREDVSKYFELDMDSPYMLLVAKVKEDIRVPITDEDKKLFGINKLNVKKSTIPAITHVDYSARIQTVHEDTNPKYYKLLKNLKKQQVVQY